MFFNSSDIVLPMPESTFLRLHNQWSSCELFIVYTIYQHDRHTSDILLLQLQCIHINLKPPQIRFVEWRADILRQMKEKKLNHEYYQCWKNSIIAPNTFAHLLNFGGEGNEFFFVHSMIFISIFRERRFRKMETFAVCDSMWTKRKYTVKICKIDLFCWCCWMSESDLVLVLFDLSHSIICWNGID